MGEYAFFDIRQTHLPSDHNGAAVDDLGGVAAYHMDAEQLSVLAPDDELDEEPAELMHVPEPKKRMMHFFTGGGKQKREPQIQIDPESGKKILRKPKVVNKFKVHQPVTDW